VFIAKYVEQHKIIVEVIIVDNYIQYTFYDEVGKKVAIIYQNTPKEIIKKLQEQYDEVKYKE